ncbi:hypothetical protein BD770DRAFT_376378, partial [Pilaira anomala]
MFSRESTQHGMIELIIDKKKPTITTTTPTLSTSIANKTINNNNHFWKTKGYDVILSIDLANQYDYDNLSMMDNEASFDNLQRLMDSLTKIAQEKTYYYVNVLNLLKKLHSQQEEHRFMSCIDKYNEKILVYFPNTISFSVDQTYIWLKHTIGIDVSKFRQWELLSVVAADAGKSDAVGLLSKIVDDDDDTKGCDSGDSDPFDGESYFNDIHMFINHVDSLIESNGLFSHHPTREPM